MPAARGVKRAASKASASSASTASKNKKKRGAAVHLEIPLAPKKRGRVFACGQGDVGQLGLGEDVIETTKFKHVTALGDNIVAICAGGMHTIALDSSGKVWTNGCNDEGALGRTTTGDKDEGTPKKVALPAGAVAVSAGDSHSAALLQNGDVYAWGSFRDSHGSMGLIVRGREGKPCRAPVHVEVGEPAVGIASGSDHLVILSASGAVYTMGCGEQGQLGRLTQRSASRDARQGFSALLVPGRVTLKQGASAVWAGYHATFVLDGNQEKVFAFGLNNYGQLGITGEKRKTALYAPVECDAFTRLEASWRAVAPGQHHSLALSDAGQVHAVGRCEYGRLGLGEGSGDAEALEPVPKLVGKKCVSIACGTSNSFAVTDTGEVWAWGMGSEGQLGTGSCSDAAAPAPAPLACHAARVAAGGQHTALLSEDPNPTKEPSPEPEPETAEEKTEADAEEEEEEEEPEEKPRAKRARKAHEGEVTSSTASAQASEVKEDTKPQKLNGDENKDAAMEVDETDNQPSEDKKEEEESTPETEQKMDTETEQPEPKADDTSSQGTSDSETKSQDSQDSTKSQETAKSEETTQNQETTSEETTNSQETKSEEAPKNQESDSPAKDVEMTDKIELNGTEESEKVEVKTVEDIQNPLTTTA